MCKLGESKRNNSISIMYDDYAGILRTVITRNNHRYTLAVKGECMTTEKMQLAGGLVSYGVRLFQVG